MWQNPSDLGTIVRLCGAGPRRALTAAREKVAPGAGLQVRGGQAERALQRCEELRAGGEGLEIGYGGEYVKYGEVLISNACKSLMFWVVGRLRAYVQRNCSFEIKKQHVDNCEDVQVLLEHSQLRSSCSSPTAVCVQHQKQGKSSL